MGTSSTLEEGEIVVGIDVSVLSRGKDALSDSSICCYSPHLFMDMDHYNKEGNCSFSEDLARNNINREGAKNSGGKKAGLQPATGNYRYTPGGSAPGSGWVHTEV